MSLSFLRRAALLGLMAAPAWAQQTYFIPAAEVTTQYDSNRELRTVSSTVEKSTSYLLDVEAVMGRDTPRTQTEVHPRITYQQFPDRSGVDPLEYFLDLHHDYHTIKGRFGILARYAHQDTINAELGGAGFDDGDPNTPPTDDASGIVFVGQTRRTYEVTPTFDYALTEKMSLAGNLNYQAVDYDTNLVNQRVGYTSPTAELDLVRKFTPRTAFRAGPYVSRYKADDKGLPAGGALTTNTYGLTLGVDHDWSETSHVSVALRGERNDTHCNCLAPLESSSTTNWGLEIAGIRDEPTGSLRYGIGRFLAPSTLGTRRQSDQVRVQYNRRFSERLEFDGAVRFLRDRSVGVVDSRRDRDRIRADVALKRMVTRTWYVALGYRYAWQDLKIATDSADNHMAYISIGIKGLDPRRGQR